MRNIFYLDTSGLNFLADNVKDFDAFAKIKNHLGFELYLSPVSLWEILLNSNDQRKDYLIYWAQFNCSNNLLKSPTEIIIKYILLHCPLKDRKAFFDDPYTKMELGKTWKNIHGKIDKTIPIDLDSLKERSIPIRKLSKSLKSIISSMCNEEHVNYSDDPFHLSMKQALKNLDHPDASDKESERIYKITLIFLLFIVCIGFELQNNVVREYWDDLQIEDPFDRLDYLLENHPILMVRGPVVEMAKMADIQLSMDNSKSRGLLHDCLHSVYCYYSDNLITGDAHFKFLREQNKHPVFERIIMTEQIEDVWKLTIKQLTSDYGVKYNLFSIVNLPFDTVSQHRI
ncbi:MAG: hypothetical protein V3U87_07335 [Methylococcaceae bacterium]